MNKWARETHRWVSLAFTVVVLSLIAAQALGGEVAEWVYLLPVAPLLVLMLTGAYLWALPYFAKRREG